MRPHRRKNSSPAPQCRARSPGCALVFTETAVANCYADHIRTKVSSKHHGLRTRAGHHKLRILRTIPNPHKNSKPAVLSTYTFLLCPLTAIRLHALHLLSIFTRYLPLGGTVKAEPQAWILTFGRKRSAVLHTQR